jgi:hypothetical protein
MGIGKEGTQLPAKPTSDDEKNGTVRNTKEVREHQWERQQRENQVTVIKDYQLL